MNEYYKNSFPYRMGYDCGKNGANEHNCDFSIFNTPENTKLWEMGKKEAEEEKISSL